MLSMGRVNQKVEPSPGVLSTPISPPNWWMMLLQMGRPSPVPYTKVFTLTKRSKMRLQFSRLMPMPVSLT